MNNKIIIADAGPLIAFAKIQKLNILTEIFGTVLIPMEVAEECLVDMEKPGARAIEDALKSNSIHIPSDEIVVTPGLSGFFGDGEAAAISLAIKLNCRLLIDEKLGRKFAKQKNIRVIGTAGVLLLAKEKQLINAVAPLIKDLESAGYYLSKELIKSVMSKAKEQTASVSLFEKSK